MIGFIRLFNLIKKEKKVSKNLILTGAVKATAQRNKRTGGKKTLGTFLAELLLKFMTLR